MPLLFVSNDGGFADPTDKNRLHSDLTNDLTSGLSAQLCRNITDVFAEIGQPTDAADLLPVVNSTQVIQALVSAILDKTFPGIPGVREGGFSDGNRRLVTIGELLNADHASFEKFHGTPAACTTAGQSLLCATGTWIFPLPPEDSSDLTHYALGEMSGGLRGLEVTATLVIALTANDSVTQVQIVDFWTNVPLRPAILVTRHEHYVSTTPVLPGLSGEWEEVDLTIFNRGGYRVWSSGAW